MTIKSCKKELNEEKKMNVLMDIINKFFKNMLIIGIMCMLVFIRKHMKNNITIGKLMGYLLLACISMTCIYIADSFVYNNLIVGLGVYLGYELLKL